jgi:hypothetical protein
MSPSVTMRRHTVAGVPNRHSSMAA